MDPDLPLDEDELDELDAFLRSDAVGEDAMDVSMLDGFLTALAVGPTNLPPALWLPMIWGKGVSWPSEKIAERLRALVLRHANYLLLYLREEPEAFEPLLLERDDENQKVVPVIDGWCIGFVRGMALDEASWKPCWRMTKTACCSTSSCCTARNTACSGGKTTRRSMMKSTSTPKRWRVAFPA